MTASACEELARVADAHRRRASGLARPTSSWSSSRVRVAGIRRGPLAVLGLFAGGRSRLRGGGFRPDLRDRTASQTRHFAGIARAVTVVGAARTEWLSVHVRRDAPDLTRRPADQPGDRVRRRSCWTARWRPGTRGSGSGQHVCAG